MLRASRPVLAFFDAIKNLRLRQLALILKAGYEPNLMINSRAQNGLQFLLHYFNSTDAHFRLQLPLNRSAYLAIAKLLLDSGLDANAPDFLTGETVLFDAIRYNDRDLVALLLNYVDLSVRNRNGETALMCAARFGSKQVVRMVLEHLHQLDLDELFLRQRNRFGLKALDLARNENLEAAKVIAKHLVAFGGPQSPVGASSSSSRLMMRRASSHHQLLAGGPAVNLQRRAVGVVDPPLYLDEGVAGPAVDPLDVDPTGDDHLGLLEDPELMYSYQRRRRAAAAAAAAARCYDPKAAEFNRYLLERGTATSRPGGLGTDEDEDYDGGVASDEMELGGGGGSGAGGQLYRSRSCMLAPSSSRQQQQQQSAAGASKSKYGCGGGTQSGSKQKGAE